MVKYIPWSPFYQEQQPYSILHKQTSSNIIKLHNAYLYFIIFPSDAELVSLENDFISKYSERLEALKSSDKAKLIETLKSECQHKQSIICELEKTNSDISNELKNMQDEHTAEATKLRSESDQLRSELEQSNQSVADLQVKKTFLAFLFYGFNVEPIN